MISTVLYVYTVPEVCLWTHCYVTQHLYALAWVWGA